MATIIGLLGVILIGFLALAGVLFGGMRLHWSPATEAMRRLTIVLNRGQQGSGQPGAYAGILRHVGRTSGTVHETPLGIERTDDGFVIAIVYGQHTQWVKNVLAAGSAEVMVDGEVYAVERPEVVPMSGVSSYFKPSDRRMTSLVGVTEALRLYHADHD